MGPYIFLRYCGRDQLTALVKSMRGKIKRVSVSNLVPLHTMPRIAPDPVVEEGPPVQMFDSSDSDEGDEVLGL